MACHRRDQRGFTLVELLIVVIILGILAAVVIPQFNAVSSDAKESSLVANLNTVRQAISLYRVQHNETYPGQANWSELVTQLTTGTDATGAAGTKYGPYLRTTFPANPMTNTTTGTNVATMPSAATGATAWIYCNNSGEIRANNVGVAPSGADFFSL